MLKDKYLCINFLSLCSLAVLPACGSLIVTPISKIFSLTSAFSVALAPWIGTKQLGVSGASTQANGVVTDSSGNVFLAGYTTGNLDGNTLSGIGSTDLFVAEYNSSGTKKWTNQLGVSGKITQANAVAKDSSGNIFVAGQTNGNLDGNTLTGSGDFFVTKYSSSGTKQWTNQLGASLKATQAMGVATDSAGNIFVTGQTNGNLDGNTLTGAFDFFVTKYDSSGNKQWTNQLGVALQSTWAKGVTTDLSGNIYVGGYTTGNLDGNILAGIYDLFLTKYDSSGNKQWTILLGVALKTTWAKAITSDSSGNIFLAGYTTGNLDGNVLAGNTDFFVTKYDSSGNKQWTKQLGFSLKSTQANGAAADSEGNVFVTGYSNGNLDGNTVTGTFDFFVTKYDSSGTKQWTKQLGVSGAGTQANGVATDLLGNVFVAGHTGGNLDGNTLIGGSDFFVSKYNSSGLKQ